ncbi:MAG TPA: 3-deoxy-7-phosphoheptulonate synthase [Candidatus Saccharimonadales bacterium]|nr:3-deoxy-7-phosphoheptulonate synthase [Candidatus Saccharimonadales bacterium]
MSRPEIESTGLSILQESARIRDELLRVQLSVQACAATHESKLLEGVRQRLGYDEVGAVDLSGLVNTRATTRPMITAGALARVLPISFESAETTRRGRQAATDIFSYLDDRLHASVGGCSTHNPEESIEFAERYVIPWRKKYGPYVEIQKREYLEKPRTPRPKLEWKGFTYDPLLDDSFDINLGLVAARMILCRTTHLGAPTVMEMLNANTPQYLDGLITVGVIGARNATDQTSIERGAGSSSVLEIKNPLSGDINAAAMAARSARLNHTFLGISMNGWPVQVMSTGNNTAHIVLRGSSSGPNFSSDHVEEAKKFLRESGQRESLSVDLSHENSGKNAPNQLPVAREVMGQVADGEEAIRGFHAEINLVGGRQDLKDKEGKLRVLQPGVSITDECSPPEVGEEILDMAAEAVAKRRERRAA